MGREKFNLSLQCSSHTPSLSKVRTGTWKQELRQRPWRSDTHWLAPHGWLNLPTYRGPPAQGWSHASCTMLSLPIKQPRKRTMDLPMDWPDRPFSQMKFPLPKCVELTIHQSAHCLNKANLNLSPEDSCSGRAWRSPCCLNSEASFSQLCKTQAFNMEESYILDHIYQDCISKAEMLKWTTDLDYIYQDHIFKAETLKWTTDLDTL